MSEKSLKQLLNDSTRLKDLIHKKQEELVSVKKVLKETRNLIKEAKKLMASTAKKKVVKKIAKPAVSESESASMS